MSLEDKLLVLFERTLNTNDNEHLQKIIQNQARLIQQKQHHHKENEKPMVSASLTSIQKKLQAIEKNYMCQESTKKRRHSRYDVRSKTNSIYESSHRRTPTQPNEDESIFNCNEISEFYDDLEVNQLKKENHRLLEKLHQLEYQEREHYIKFQGELEQLKKEKQNLIDIKKKYEQQEATVHQRMIQLDQKEIQLNNLHVSLGKQNQKSQARERELDEYEQQLDQRRENMDQMQSHLTSSMQKILQLNKNDLKQRVQQQLGYQMEALEQYFSTMNKERDMIQKEYKYLKQLKTAIMEEKKELFGSKQ